MKTKSALLLESNTPFAIETLTLDDPKDGEVLVKIEACGVCHSDYHLRTGTTQHPMPVVCGHEGAGVVEAVGKNVTRVKIGDHVTLSWTPDCGQCYYCLRGQPTLCETFTAPIWAGTMLDGTTRLRRENEQTYTYCGLGTFSEYVVVPQQSCVPIRNDVPLKVASLVGCAVATGVGAALYTANVRPTESVVIIGCGGVGLNAIQGAKLCGASTIIAVDITDAKAQLAYDFGATHFLRNDEHLLEAIHDLTEGRGADHAIEAVGLPKLQELAMDVVRAGGTVTLAGLSAMGSATNLPGAVIVRKELTIKGSYYGSVNPQRDFPMLVDLYADGQLKLDELISQEYALENINEAFDAMLTGEVARGIVVF